MAANATDFFTEVGSPGSATTLSAPGHSIAGTSINVGSTSNWPTTTGVIFAIDTYTLQTIGGVSTQVRNVGSYTEWEGTVSGSVVSNLVLRYGTDQAYSAGGTTRVYIPVASSRENRFTQGVLVAHNQDGTLKNNAVTTASIATDAVTTVKILDANVTNAKLAANVAWAVWTPTWTGVTVGNGTVTARYMQIGKFVKAFLFLQLGSTSAVTGAINFSLPVTGRVVNSTPIMGQVYIEDNAVAGYIGFYRQESTTTGALVPAGTAGTFLNISATSATAPFTWGTTDFFTGYFEYEAA